MTDPTRPDPDPSLDTVVTPTPGLPPTPDAAPIEAAASVEAAPPVEPGLAAPAVPVSVPDASSSPVLEPAAAAIATTPVAATAAPRPRRSRARWAVALAVVAVVVLASAAAAFVLTAGSSTATIRLNFSAASFPTMSKSLRRFSSGTGLWALSTRSTATRSRMSP